MASDVKQSLPGNAVEGDTAIAELLHTPYADALVLSRTEKRVLELCDEHEEQSLERSLLEAQSSLNPREIERLSDEAVQEQLLVAEREAAESRARYMLRNSIVRSALTTDPVLKAVHSGRDSAPHIRKLSPLVNERDTISMLHNTLTKQSNKVTADLESTEQSITAANRVNKDLAKRLLDLTDQVKEQEIEDVEDPGIRAQLVQLQRDIRNARRQWRIVESVLSGTIVGSGVDWARDPDLRDLVLDDEDELES